MEFLYLPITVIISFNQLHFFFNPINSSLSERKEELMEQQKKKLRVDEWVGRLFSLMKSMKLCGPPAKLFPFSSFLLFCLAQRESKKKRELMGLPRFRLVLHSQNQIEFMIDSIHKSKISSFHQFIQVQFVLFIHYEMWLAFLSSFSSLSGAVRLVPPITPQRKEKTKQAGLHSLALPSRLAHPPPFIKNQRFLNNGRAPKAKNKSKQSLFSHSQREKMIV